MESVIGKSENWWRKLPDTESAIRARIPESVGSTRTCPVHAVLGVLTLMTYVLVRFPVRRHPSLPRFDQA